MVIEAKTTLLIASSRIGLRSNRRDKVTRQPWRWSTNIVDPATTCRGARVCQGTLEPTSFPAFGLKPGRLSLNWRPRLITLETSFARWSIKPIAGGRSLALEPFEGVVADLVALPDQASARLDPAGVLV